MLLTVSVEILEEKKDGYVVPAEDRTDNLVIQHPAAGSVSGRLELVLQDQENHRVYTVDADELIGAVNLFLR